MATIASAPPPPPLGPYWGTCGHQAVFSLNHGNPRFRGRESRRKKVPDPREKNVAYQCTPKLPKALSQGGVDVTISGDVICPSPQSPSLWLTDPRLPPQPTVSCPDQKIRCMALWMRDSACLLCIHASTSIAIPTTCERASATACNKRSEREHMLKA